MAPHANSTGHYAFEFGGARSELSQPEGNVVWHLPGGADDAGTRAMLEGKRKCLLTVLSAAVPDRGNGLSHVGEIGFNAGHSAASILAALPHASVTSFDLCAWGYGAPAYALLQRHFGARRLTRVCGDSGLTVRTHAQRLATRMASRSTEATTTATTMRRRRCRGCRRLRRFSRPRPR
jgi:hypothetical protein